MKKNWVILYYFIFLVSRINAFAQSNENKDENAPYVFCYGIVNTSAPIDSESVKGAWAIKGFEPPSEFCGKSNNECKYFRLHGDWGNRNSLLGTLGSSGWMNYFRLDSDQTLDDVRKACFNAFKHPDARETLPRWSWNRYPYLNKSDFFHPFRGNYQKNPYKQNTIDLNEIPFKDESLSIYPVAIASSIASNLTSFQYPIIENSKKLYYLDYTDESNPKPIGRNGIKVEDPAQQAKIDMKRDENMMTGNFLNYQIIYDYIMISEMAFTPIALLDLNMKDLFYVPTSNVNSESEGLLKDSKIDIFNKFITDSHLNLDSPHLPQQFLNALVPFGKNYNFSKFCQPDKPDSDNEPNCDNPDDFKTIGVMLPSTFSQEGRKPWRGVYISKNEDTGSYGVAVASDKLKRIVIGFKGTGKTDSIFSDIQIISGIQLKGNILVNYLTNAYAFYSYIKELINSDYTQYKDYEIVFTGHSLGGYIAAYTALKTNKLARIFSSVSTYIIYEFFQLAYGFSPANWLATTSISTGYLPLPNVINFTRTLDPVTNSTQLLWRNTPINSTIGFPAISNLNVGDSHSKLKLIPDIYYPFMKQFQENTDKFPVPLNSVHLDLSRGLKALASILKSKIIKPRNITENDPATLSYLYFYPDTIISGDCDVILNQVTGNKCGDNNEPVDLKSSKNNIPFSLNFVGYFNDYKPYYNTFSYL